MAPVDQTATATPAEQKPSQVEADTLARMETWVAKGLGDRPYIGTKEEWDKLPDIGRQEIIKLFPEHAEYLAADETKLPAELRVRMAKKQLLFTDLDALESAGYHAATAFLHKARQAAMLATWEANIEQGRQEMAAMAAEREAQWAKAQAEGLERSNRMLREQYVRQLKSGSSVKQPTGPVRIGGK